MFPLANGETITRLRRTLTNDPFSGLPTKGDWTNADRVTIEGVSIQPSSTVEAVNDSRAQVITQMSLYCETGADVLPMDRIETQSGIWEIQGELQNYASGFTGWSPGSEFAIKKTTET